MANQDQAIRPSNPPIQWTGQIREIEAKRVGMNVFVDGTYCSVLELGCFANLLRSSGSSQSLNRFVGSPFIQQKHHNYAGQAV